MPGFYLETQKCADYYMLVEPRPEGSAIGFLAGNAISEKVRDLFGRHFSYAGAAPRKHDGSYDLDALRKGEFIVAPGLVYRMEDVEQPRKAASMDNGLPQASLISPAEMMPLEERRKMGREIGFTLMAWLGSALVVHLVFLALGTG